jgi:mevalonate kinase
MMQAGGDLLRSDPSDLPAGNTVTQSNHTMTREENCNAFFGKVMLFGEYSLMAGSQALTIPTHAFSGELAFPAGLPEADLAMAKASNKHLWSFFLFLSGAGAESGLPAGELSLERFGEDLENGMFFRSTIPSGYGLGSSGALVAAVFSRYRNHKAGPSGTESGDDYMDEPTGMMAQPGWRDLKRMLAGMESFFHGTSSGIDPLSCLVGKPLLLEPGGEVRLADLKPFPPGFPGGFFLLDTATTGKTGPLVQAFLRKYEEPAFRDLMDRQYVPLVNASIASLLHQNARELLSLLHGVSAFQQEHFLPMIPVHMWRAWDQGLETGAYALKLCGSGGGGYLLGFTGDLQQAKEDLRLYKFLPLEVVSSD